MLELLVYGCLALVAPYAIFAWFRNGRRTVFEGKVNISTVGLLTKQESLGKPYNFVTVFMPDGSTLTMEVDKKRLASLSFPAVSAEITVSQPFFGERYVSSVRWPGETAAGKGETRNGLLYLSVTYLLLGLGAFTVITQPANSALLGLMGNAYAALLFVLTGWAIGGYLMPSVPADLQGRFLGVVPMGEGRQSVAIMAAVAFALTAGCFWYGGLAMFVGLNPAVALGILLSLLAKPVTKAEGQTSAV